MSQTNQQPVLLAVSAPPLLFIWSNRCRHTLLRQLRTPGQRVKNVLIVVLAGLIVWVRRRSWRCGTGASRRRGLWHWRW